MLVELRVGVGSCQPAPHVRSLLLSLRAARRGLLCQGPMPKVRGDPWGLGESHWPLGRVGLELP